MKLHPIKSSRENRIYCGPTAVATITGRSIECVEAWINTYRRKRQDKVVVASQPFELVYALKELGYKAVRTERYDVENKNIQKPTLAKWLRSRKDRNQVYIIHITNHYVTVKGNKLIDNHTMEPVFIRQAPHRRARVHSVIHVVEDSCENAARIRRKRKDVMPPEFQPIAKPRLIPRWYF